MHALLVRNFAAKLLDKGYSREQVSEVLNTLRDVLAKASREEEEDAVLEAMDFLHGFCSNHMKL